LGFLEGYRRRGRETADKMRFSLKKKSKDRDAAGKKTCIGSVREKAYVHSTTSQRQRKEGKRKKRGKRHDSPPPAFVEVNRTEKDG